MYEDILTPTDGSDGARAALERGIDLADRYGATVHALYVASLEGVDDHTTAHLEEMGQTLEAEGQEAVEEAQAIARETDVEVVTEVKRGEPYRNILGYAERNDVDLIVMGTRGKSGIERVLLGSVAEKVVRHADVPVTVVPPPSES